MRENYVVLCFLSVVNLLRRLCVASVTVQCVHGWRLKRSIGEDV